MLDIDLIKFWIVNPETHSNGLLLEFPSLDDKFNYINRLKEEDYLSEIDRYNSCVIVHHKPSLIIPWAILFTYTNMSVAKNNFEIYVTAKRTRENNSNLEKALLELNQQVCQI